MISAATLADGPRGTAEVSFVESDVNAAFVEWKERGLEITSDVYDMGAGLMFGGEDPDGRRVSVHQLHDAVREAHGQHGM